MADRYGMITVSLEEMAAYYTGGDADVPCSGCTACCRGEPVFLVPECGDSAEEYETVAAVNPADGVQGVALKQKANGDCIYLGPDGCKIHGRAPSVCRQFDCRRWFYFQGDRAERRRLIKEAKKHKDRNLIAVYEAARARAHTLDRG